jgi:hypothetical protein
MDEMASDGRNIIFENSRVKTRWGYDNIGTNLPLDGTITGVAEYKELRGDSTTKIACTTESVSAYNSVSDLWETITPFYNTGTITWPNTGAIKEVEAGTTSYTSICSPDTDKIAIAYRDVSDSGKGKCVAGTIAADGTITLGAIVEFEAGSTNWISICSPDTDKIAIAYADGGDGSKGKCVVGTISGVTITINVLDIEEFEPGSTSYTSICSPDTDKIAIAYSDVGDSGRGSCTVATIATTTLTFGAITQFMSLPTFYISVSSPNTDQVVVSFVVSTTNDEGWCTPLSISGTTLSLGTGRQFNSGNTLQTSVCSPDTDKITVAYIDNDDGNKGKVLVGTLSGNVLTLDADSLLTFHSGATGHPAICSSNTDKVSIAYQDDGDSGKGKNIVGSIVGTTLTLGADSEFEPGAAAFNSACSYDVEKIGIAFVDNDDGFKGKAISINYRAEGSGVTWSGTWPNNTYEIKFGTTDIGGTGSPDVWYLINDFLDTDSLVLAVYSTSVQSGVSYVIRQNLISIASTYFDVCNIVEDLSAQNELLILTNYEDYVQKYTGTGSMAILGGNPPYARYCMVYYGHLLLGNCKDNATGAALPQSVYWSVRGNPEDWTNSGYGFVDLLDNDDEITGMEILGERAFIFKEKSIVGCTYTGQADPAFVFTEDMITEVGCPSGRTIVNTGREIIFLASDNVYSFNGFEIVPVGSPIIDDLLSVLNTTYDYKSHAVNLPTKNLYCLFITTTSDTNPDLCYVYHYYEKSWTIWAFADNITATTVLEDDTIMMGDSAGYVYDIDFTDTNDNGTNISAYIDTKDFNFISQQIGEFTARINESVVRLRDNAGQVNVYASTDHGNTWSLPVTINQNITEEMRDHIQNWFLRSRHVMFRIENVSGSEYEMESFEISLEKSGTNRR